MMNTPRVLREAEAIAADWTPPLPGRPPWQGECTHNVGMRSTLESRRLDGGPRCVQCNAVIK